MGGVAAVMVKGPLPEFVRVKTLSELAAKAAGDRAAARAMAVRKMRMLSMGVKTKIVSSSYS
jgi:hypothetical protein